MAWWLHRSNHQAEQAHGSDDDPMDPKKMHTVARAQLALLAIRVELGVMIEAPDGVLHELIPDPARPARPGGKVRDKRKRMSERTAGRTRKRTA